MTGEPGPGLLAWLRSAGAPVSPGITEEDCLRLSSSPPESAFERRPSTRCIVVHHSATRDGSVRHFRVMHRAVSGWTDVGYHYVIGNGILAGDGLVEKGRPEWAVGAHARGSNTESIGICLVGDFSGSLPSAPQAASLARLLSRLMEEHSVPKDCVLLHREVPGCVTECPGALFTRGFLEGTVLAGFA